MGIMFRLLAFSLFLSAHHCLHWSAKPANHQILYACVESDVTIPWSFNTSGKEGVNAMEWFYDGHSSEMIAMYAHGSFVELPAFSHRVQFVANAGLKLLTVTQGDAGNYSVEVIGFDEGGISFTVRRSVELLVVDNLQTSDGNLHVSEAAAAILDPNRNQWFIQLQCGAFTYVNSPPFDVEWVTPSGAVSPSTSSYENGYFRFRVPNPVATGNYTCRIPPQSAREACIHGNHGYSVFFLDGREARLKLLEVRQEKLQADNLLLQRDNLLLQKDSLQLHAQNTQLNATLEAYQGVANAQRAVMENQINDLMSQVEVANRSLELVHERESHQVVFYAYQLATGDREVTAGNRLVMSAVSVNQGNAYNASTGIFTAPYDGTYFFAASSATFGERNYARFKFSGDRTGGAYANVGIGSNIWGSGSLQITDSLLAGQRVWVKAVITMHYGSGLSSFSGFLIARL